MVRIRIVGILEPPVGFDPSRPKAMVPTSNTTSSLRTKLPLLAGVYHDNIPTLQNGTNLLFLTSASRLN